MNIPPCKTCQRFPVPTSKFPEVGISLERHGTLYRCVDCGTLIELIAEERSGRITPVGELLRFYPEAFRE